MPLYSGIRGSFRRIFPARERKRVRKIYIFEAATTVGLKTSVATINRIAAEMAFKSVFTQKQEKLTSVQKAYRVKFCREVQMWECYLLPWVFTDETMLVLNPVKQKIRVVRGVDVDAKFSEVRGYPQKVMVCGVIGHNFKSPLVRVTGTMKPVDYQNLLVENEIFTKLNERYGARGDVFQHHGARPHTASTTKQFLAERAMMLPDQLHWPASSPDLNVIENLRAILKSRIDYSRITDSNSLFEEAERIWESLSLQTINNCIADFGPRLEACLSVDGECLNRYKRVLKGFRVSVEAGQMALDEIKSEKAVLANFIAASRQFFAIKMKDFVPDAQLSDDDHIRSLQISHNHVIWQTSQDI